MTTHSERQSVAGPGSCVRTFPSSTPEPMSVIRQWPEGRWTCDRCSQGFPDTEERYSDERGVYYCGRCMVDALTDQLRGAVCLSDAEWERVIWLLNRPMPPGPTKGLDVAIIGKINRQRRQ